MTQNPISRRGLLAGLGAVGGAAALSTTAGRADAAPARPGGGGSAQAASGARRVSPDTVPAVPTPIASAPVAGVSYRFRGWQEFTPEVNAAEGRKWGGVGTYTNVTADYVAAFWDIPPGAVIHDLEVYLSNTTAVTVFGITWVAGVGPYPNPYWVQAAAPANAAVHAVNFPVSSTVNGPFPHGTRVGISLSTPTDGSVQVNGARLGLVHAPAAPVLLSSPVRMYDSRTSEGPLGGGHSRSLSLAARLPVGAVGAIVNLTVTDTVGAGYLSVYAAGSPVPATSSVNWFASGQTFGNQATSAVSGSRAITVTAGGPHEADYIVDLIGYLV